MSRRIDRRKNGRSPFPALEQKRVESTTRRGVALRVVASEISRATDPHLNVRERLDRTVSVAIRGENYEYIGGALWRTVVKFAQSRWEDILPGYMEIFHILPPALRPFHSNRLI